MTTEHVAAQINAWEVAQRQFDLAADRLGIDPGMRRVLGLLVVGRLEARGQIGRVARA